jgi:hypothetical protein
MLKTLRTPALMAAGALMAVMALPTWADQGHMQATLASLQQAQENLSKADHDKGGHRAKALDLIKQAQAEVQAGMDFDRANDSKGEKGKKK